MLDGLKDAACKAGGERALHESSTATQEALRQLGAFYLGIQSTSAQGDPVACFHLDNGARLERLNTLADLSAKGVKQSLGLMVNYLYDLGKVESHHEKFVHGEVAQSRAIASLI
ncbi:malonyl-CoA decarboxylase domain-containing protein [Piscinibacter terrae]